MASVNKVIIVGNLGNDPELRRFPNGDPIANIAVATSFKSRDRKTGEPWETTEWHRIVLHGRLAEIAGQYLRKGASIYVEGRLQTRKYTDRGGIERYVTEIVGEQMQMMSTPAAAPRQDIQPQANHAGAVQVPTQGQADAAVDTQAVTDADTQADTQVVTQIDNPADGLTVGVGDGQAGDQVDHVDPDASVTSKAQQAPDLQTELPAAPKKSTKSRTKRASKATAVSEETATS